MRGTFGNFGESWDGLIDGCSKGWYNKAQVQLINIRFIEHWNHEDLFFFRQATQVFRHHSSSLFVNVLIFVGPVNFFRIRAQNKGDAKLPDVSVKDGASEKSEYKPASKRRATMGTE